MQKINFVLNNVGTSGGAKVVRKYASNLNKMGYDTCIYVPLIPYIYGNQNAFIKFLRKIKGIIRNFYNYFIKKEQKKFKECHYKVALLIRNQFIRDADATIATAWPTSFDVDRLNDNKGKKFYFVQDYEIWDVEELGKKSYELNLNKIVISNWIKEQIEKQGIKSNMPILFNGLDIDIYKNDNKIYKKDIITCLMLSHDNPKKGIKDGINSFELAHKKNPNLKLVMFGLHKPKEIPEYVKFYENPNQDQIAKLYRDSDIFIFPALQEGWGLTVVEAMSARCAVVGTKTGCLVDIGKDNYNALISKPGDIETMSNNILKLSKDEKLRKNISENGYETVKDMNWQKQTEKLIQILNE